MSSIKLKGSTSGDVTITVPAQAGTNTVTIPAVTGTLPLSNLDHVTNRPNANPIIINGDMAVAQRGTSFTSQTGVAYHLDRYEISAYNVGDGVYRVDQSTDVPSGQGFVNSNKVSCTTADTSQDANNQMYFQTQLEGTATSLLNYFVASPDTVTIAFWVRSNRTGTHSLALKLSDNGSVENNTATRIYHKLYTISSANTWEKIVCAITLDSSTSETKVTGTGFAVAVQFWLGAGSNRDGVTADQWADNGNNTATSDNLDLLGSTSNDWYITGLQMEVGSFDSTTIPPFQHESFANNLLRCKRYYQQSYASGTTAGTVTNDGAYMIYQPATGNSFRFNLIYEIAMRAIPTKVFYVPSTGTVGKAGYEGGGDTNAFTISTTFNTNKKALLFNTSVPATGVPYWHWTADSEL